jgi:hypothetical protein
MHASLVFDEAGSTSLRGFFDNKLMVTSLIDELKSARLARSFIVVVALAFRGGRWTLRKRSTSSK